MAFVGEPAQQDLEGLAESCYRIEKDIAAFARKKLIPLVVRREMRRSRLYRNWWRAPMNYARCIELPLAHKLLDASVDDRILDIGSPKLMPLYHAHLGYRSIVASDIAPEFADDLQMICKTIGVSMQTRAVDARSLPFPDMSFDRVYSISVIEHIPNDGDRLAISEIARVLAPGGRFVMTLPAYPDFMEEWLSSRFGWESFSVRRADGRCFYQRRYSPYSLVERFGDTKLEFEDIIYIAETPLKPTYVRDDGMLSHNCTQVEERYRQKWRNRWLDYLPHFRYNYVSKASRQFRYLTRDGHDPQIRQVAISMRKA